MGSTFFGLGVALSGLTTHQRALDTVSHNLANATTPGYSRQRVETAAGAPQGVPALNSGTGAGQIGTGVVAEAHTRLRDRFADVRVRAQAAASGEADARADALRHLDSVIDEPGETGVAGLLQEFWGSWQALSLDPASAAAREATRHAGRALAEGFRDLDARLTATGEEAGARIGLEVGRVNELAGRVELLNREIATAVASGREPNDLRDRRDLALDEIAGMAEITVSEAAGTGKVTVALGSQVLVDGTTDTVAALAVDGAGAATVGGAPTTIASGSLRGHVDVRDAIVGGPDGYAARLDALASAVADSVNGVHEAAYGLDGGTGRAFFAGTDAAGIALSAPVEASSDAIAAAEAPGDLPAGADAAIAIAQLQFLEQGIGGSTTTLDGFHAALVAEIGVETDRALRVAEVQRGVLDAAHGSRSSVSGVNLDEEMADMVRFQKSYNAAARMVTTIDEMLETIVGRMGIVGR